MTKLDQTLTMLKDLTDAKGIPGNERDVKSHAVIHRNICG